MVIEAGVSINFNGSIGGTYGFERDVCKGTDCAFYEFAGNLTIALTASVKAIAEACVGVGSFRLLQRLRIRCETRLDSRGVQRIHSRGYLHRNYKQPWAGQDRIRGRIHRVRSRSELQVSNIPVMSLSLQVFPGHRYVAIFFVTLLVACIFHGKLSAQELETELWQVPMKVDRTNVLTDMMLEFSFERIETPFSGYSPGLDSDRIAMDDFVQAVVAGDVESALNRTAIPRHIGGKR